MLYGAIKIMMEIKIIIIKLVPTSENLKRSFGNFKVENTGWALIFSEPKCRLTFYAFSSNQSARFKTKHWTNKTKY